MKIPEALFSKATFQLTNTARLLFNWFNKEFQSRDFEVKAEQMPILFVLSITGEKSQQEIADLLQKDKAGVFRSLKSLQKMGYISFHEDENDNRKKIVRLTESGKHLCNKANEIGEELNKQILEGISEEEINQLKSVLAKINVNILRKYNPENMGTNHCCPG